MSNFYQDNPDIQFHLKRMDLSRIVEMREDGFSEKDQYPEAPVDLADAVDNYCRVIDIVGDISGNFVAPRARGVDEVGARYRDGEVIYAPGTLEAIDRLKQAELMGFTLPRKYGGLNLPKTLYSIATELISRGDASLMNIFGLQEISDTINKFATEEQKERYLPRFSSGEVMGSMALTEPDAGSDLQTVMLKAAETEDGKWQLSGVKRFITNGCANISLVMARSEAGTAGGRGISLFIYERDENMKIRRIETKLGIHGSPTCELQFDDAEAELLGKRKLGLIKYVMSLMNGARLGVAAQALGIAEAAYREAAKYAKDRIQFKKPIRNFTAVYEMLTDMRVNIEATRSLLYETSRIVDIKEGIDDIMVKDPDKAPELKADNKRYNRLAALFTPIVKAFASEMANKVCYDAIQIHGGVGFTCEFDVERFYRDVRITNIYEGTTQLQVVAAIGGVMGGVAAEQLKVYESEHDLASNPDLYGLAKTLRDNLDTAVSHVRKQKDASFQEYHAKRLVDMATDAITCYLVCIDALASERKEKVARIFADRAAHRVQSALNHILSGDRWIIDFNRDVIEGSAEKSD